jgi:Mce-associated membrane protein
VAGLRHPEAAPRPAELPSDAEATQVIPAITEKARPKPTRKPKQAWTPAPTPRGTNDAADVHDAVPVDPMPGDFAPEDAGQSTYRRPRVLLLPIALAVVAILIGGVATWFGLEWSHARNEVQNTALVDAAGTSEVSGQVVSAVNTILSYNYTNMQKTETAVQHLLTGNALCQYNLLYKVVKQQAPSQKLVLTTTVQAKGVEMLQGAAARVLLLVQQTDTRASTNQTSTSQSMIAVNAVKQGGTWKISGIDTFNGDNTTPNCKS